MKLNNFYSILIIILLTLFCVSCQIKLREIDNVVNDIQYKRIDSIEVDFRQIKNNQKFEDKFVIKNTNDSIKYLLYNYLNLFLYKNYITAEEVKDSLFVDKYKNNVNKDSLYIRIQINFKNTMFINISYYNYHKNGFDIYSDKYEPNLYESFIFPFMGKGFISYMKSYIDNSTIVYDDVVNLTNKLIKYHNIHLDNNSQNIRKIKK